MGRIFRERLQRYDSDRRPTYVRAEVRDVQRATEAEGRVYLALGHLLTIVREEPLPGLEED